MQCLGHLYDRQTGYKILILVRQSKYCRYLKIRKSGKDGTHFHDEEFFLNEIEQRDRLERLKSGESIPC